MHAPATCLEHVAQGTFSDRSSCVRADFPASFAMAKNSKYTRPMILKYKNPKVGFLLVVGKDGRTPYWDGYSTDWRQLTDSAFGLTIYELNNNRHFEKVEVVKVKNSKDSTIKVKAANGDYIGYIPQEEYDEMDLYDGSLIPIYGFQQELELRWLLDDFSS